MKSSGPKRTKRNSSIYLLTPTSGVYIHLTGSWHWRVAAFTEFNERKIKESNLLSCLIGRTFLVNARGLTFTRTKANEQPPFLFSCPHVTAKKKKYPASLASRAELLLTLHTFFYLHTHKDFLAFKKALPSFPFNFCQSLMNQTTLSYNGHEQHRSSLGVTHDVSSSSSSVMAPSKRLSFQDFEIIEQVGEGTYG